MSGMPKYQYYQDDSYMKVQILESNVTRENLTVVYTPDELTVKIRKGESSGTVVEYTVIHGDLYEEVDVDGCRVVVKAEKVLIKLKKKERKIEWNKLLEGRTGASSPRAPTAARRTPTAARRGPTQLSNRRPSPPSRTTTSIDRTPPIATGTRSTGPYPSSSRPRSQRGMRPSTPSSSRYTETPTRTPGEPWSSPCRPPAARA
jgi:hypothetical protein